MIFINQNLISNRLTDLVHAKSIGELISFGFSDRSVRSSVSSKCSANRWDQKRKRLHFLAYLWPQPEFRTQRKVKWPKCVQKNETSLDRARPSAHRRRCELTTVCDRRNLLLTIIIVRCVVTAHVVYDAKVQQDAGQLLFAVAMFLFLCHCLALTSDEAEICDQCSWSVILCLSVGLWAGLLQK